MKLTKLPDFKKNTLKNYGYNPIVKYLLKKYAAGGGYFMSSGNSIVPQIPIKNYMTIVRTFWRYKNYPIEVPNS